MSARLGHRDQRGRDLAGLGDVAGRAVELGRGDRLHRVDDHQVGPDRVDVAEHRRQVGLGGQESVRAIASIRSARSRTWAADSSPVT